MRIMPKKCILVLMVVLVLLTLQCRVDKDYFLFVHGEDPAGFSVSTISLAGMSICDLGADTLFTVEISALDAVGAVDTEYDGQVSLSMIQIGGAPVGVLPLSSPVFVEGRATVSDFSVVGDLVSGAEYVIRVTDSEKATLNGTSDPFVADIRQADHFTISGIPAILSSGDSFTLYVQAVDEDGYAFSQFDGTVDLLISNGWTITPDTATLFNGYAAVSVTITGSDDFEIEAVVSETQGSEVTCLGGLAAGGGGGGGGGGGSGSVSEPGSLTCNLSGPAEVLLGAGFNLSLYLTKYDTEGELYPSFSGQAALSTDPSDSGLAPTGITLTSQNGYGTFTMSYSGDYTVTASVTDDDSSLTCNCTWDMSVITGVGVFGAYAAELVSYFNAEFSSKSFYVVSSLGSIDNVSPYTGLIVNLPGSGWTGGYDLTAAEAGVIRQYYDSGRPILIAHDGLTAAALAALDPASDPIWGISVTVPIAFDPDDASAVPFQSVGAASAITGGEPAVPFAEVYCDGFDLSGAAAGVQEVVLATYGGTDYPVMVASTSGTRAIVTGESLYHAFGGEMSPETQWWETNKQLIVNVLSWLFP